jgi:hypothetical protein
MTAFITVALSAILLVFVVWVWVALRNKNRQQKEDFAGKSTILEFFSRERRKRAN